MGIGRPRSALSRLRVRTPKRNIMPLSIDEVARFWASFRTTRDLAIVGLMLLQGLRSKEILALNRDDLLLSEAQLRVNGKGSKTAFFRWLLNLFNCSTITCAWNGRIPPPPLFLFLSKDKPVVRA